jgi:hypothetical protein
MGLPQKMLKLWCYHPRDLKPWQKPLLVHRLLNGPRSVWVSVINLPIALVCFSTGTLCFMRHFQ